MGREKMKEEKSRTGFWKEVLLHIQVYITQHISPVTLIRFLWRICIFEPKSASIRYTYFAFHCQLHLSSKATAPVGTKTYKVLHQLEYPDLLCKPPVNAQDHVPKLHSALKNG